MLALTIHQYQFMIDHIAQNNFKSSEAPQALKARTHVEEL